MANYKVQTVLGPITGDQLGIVLTHEHLFVDASPLAPIKGLADCPFTLENLHWIHRNPYGHASNLQFNTIEIKEAVHEELKYFKKIGGSTIVENTTIGISSCRGFLKELATKTGVNIICGAGYYLAASQTQSTLALSIEELTNLINDDMVHGENGIQCGVIGELGSTWPIEPFEKRVLVASANVQKQLGCPVIVHPGRNIEAPFEILRIYSEAGGNVNKLVVSHLDRTFDKVSTFLDFASEWKCYSELDLFGSECSHYQLNEYFDMPSDAQRIGNIKALVDNGHGNKVVVSHDLHTKHRLRKFGGHGYSHIIENIVPKMLNRGFDAEQIDNILRNNPRAWLTE